MISSGSLSTDPARAAARERSALRRSMRAQRRALDPGEHDLRSESLCRRLSIAPIFMRVRRFAAYLSNDGEPDLSLLLARAALMGKRAYLPALHGKGLWFLPFSSNTAMVKNRFGIAEPSCHPDERLKPYALDLVLVPLVAFDSSGSRLGMGGGFYDRSFAYLNYRSRWRRPRLIGVAFDFQRAASIPSRPWDVPLDGVVTERGLIEAA
ncbi:MAG: 5-formyltetrahydrofolate cyclo-ligase [Gammaproteobacteria bacterium]|nr:5-formyltetrahydrofolate cyclo-ligase [Gammaproteobacteria bacterium]